MRELPANALRDLEAGEAWKIGLDHEHVGLELEGFGDGFLAVGRGRDELDIRLSLEHLPDAHRGQTAGIGEDDADSLFSLLGQADFPSQRGLVGAE